MTDTREQFYKTTQQYFQNNIEKDINETNIQSENNYSATSNKKYYIKEGPFINSAEVDYR